ncbi:MAG TPA: hypothetical protein PK784_08350 [Tenuifilaceae bacterium]|nr:hypothetical protein [Tenuifilaceae bacterium]
MKKISYLINNVSRRFSIDIGVFVIFFLVTLIFVISIVNTI